MVRALIKRYKQMSNVVKAGIWFTLCNFMQKGINFVTIPVFTRLMDEEEFGAFAIYSSWHNVITIFATLHLSYFVFNKGLVKFEDDRDNFVVSLQSLSAVITIGFIAVYLLFRNPINDYIGLSTAIMMGMMIQILFEPPVLYWTARRRFEYRYQAVVVTTMLMSLLNPIIGIVVIKLHMFQHDAFARVISIVVVTAVFGILFAWQIIKNAKCAFSKRYWKYALRFNLPLIPHYMSTTILSSADKIMIGQMIGKVEAGIYSVAYSIGMVCTLFSQAINQAYLPWLYKRMKKEEYGNIPNISNAFLVGVLGILTMITCFAPEVIWIVGGSEKYRSAMWAIPPICGSIFFIFLQNLFANIEYYFEKTKMIAVASVAAALLNIGLNYVFIQIAGYLAAGYTTLFCYMIYSLVHLFVLNRICKQNGIDSHNFFNFKVVFSLSVLMLVVIGLMLVSYNNVFIRYGIFLMIILLALFCHKRIINVFREIKEPKECS